MSEQPLLAEAFVKRVRALNRRAPRGLSPQPPPQPAFEQVCGWLIGISYYDTLGMFSASWPPNNRRKPSDEDQQRLDAIRALVVPDGTEPVVPRGTLRADHWHWFYDPEAN